MRALLFLTCLFLTSKTCVAQKVEREYAIKADAVPSAALTWLAEHYPTRRRERFYVDEGSERTTVESKFKADDTWYSVEFEQDGAWQNTEVEVPVPAVPERVWSEVCGVWSDRYGKFRIARVQAHTGADGQAYYEVEIRGRKDFEWDRYEAAIDSTGTVLRFDTIKLAPGHLDRW